VRQGERCGRGGGWRMSRHRTLPDTHDPDNRRCRRRRRRRRRRIPRFPRARPSSPAPPFVSVSSHIALQRSYPRQSAARSDGFPVVPRLTYLTRTQMRAHMCTSVPLLVSARRDRIIIYYARTVPPEGPRRADDPARRHYDLA